MKTSNPAHLKQYRTVNKDGSLNINNCKGLAISDLYHDLLRATWPTFLVLFTFVFFALNCLFGLIYSLIPAEQFEGFRSSEGFMHYLECFFFSVQTFGTIGYGRISPIGVPANFVVTFESYISLFVAAVLTGLIFARFARPHAKVIFSHSAVIRKFDGVPCLMFRMANERQNHITDARVAVSFAFDDPVTRFRSFSELKLERDLSPLFALSWTIAHDIDETSPLHKLPFSEWEKHNAELIVTFSGLDTVLSQTVHAKTSYIWEEILCDHDFNDVIQRGEDGKVTLLLERFNDVHILK